MGLARRPVCSYGFSSQLNGRFPRNETVRCTVALFEWTQETGSPVGREEAIAMDKKNQGKGEKNVDRKPPRGIVRRADSKEAESGGDETFAPDYTVTSTTDGGGKVLTDVEVILIFWGSFWTSTPAPTDAVERHLQDGHRGILTGPI